MTQDWKTEILDFHQKMGFTQIPNIFLSNIGKLGITGNEYLLFSMIKMFAFQKDEAFPSINKLIDVTGLTKHTIINTLKSLEKKGFIKIIRTKNSDNSYKSNTYSLKPLLEIIKQITISKINEEDKPSHCNADVTECNENVTADKEARTLHCNTDVMNCNENVIIDKDVVQKLHYDSANIALRTVQKLPPNNKSINNKNFNKNNALNTLVPNDKSFETALPKKTKIKFNYDTYQWENLDDNYMQLLRNTYPTIDINQQLNKMSAWLASNPTKRKSNFERFINSWLVKENDRLVNPRFNNNLTYKQRDRIDQAQAVTNLLNKYKEEENDAQRAIDYDDF